VWSAVILPPAEQLVAALELEPAATVCDVGAGTGALFPAIKRAAPDATVIALDASFEMLHFARQSTGTAVAQIDAVALPVRSGTADAALLAYVLFHVSDPGRALVEANRAVRRTGRVGTVTWARDAGTPAFAVWDETLTAAGAPPLSARRVDTGLDSPSAVTATLRDAGLEPIDVWTVQLERQWTAESYLQLAMGSGLNRVRLDVLDDQTRAHTLDQARDRIHRLEPDAFAWTGEVVCATARPRSRA
jgi:trans-aconitate methyltransferase